MNFHWALQEFINEMSLNIIDSHEIEYKMFESLANKKFEVKVINDIKPQHTSVKNELFESAIRMIVGNREAFIEASIHMN